MLSENARRGIARCAAGMAAVVGMLVVGAVAQEAAAPAAGAGGKSYSGTFSDAQGRKGPIQCQMTRREGNKWNLKFTGKNEGEGPNRPFDFTFDLTGKQEGEALTLSGTPDVPRQGPYEVTITTTNQVLDCKFKKGDGKNSGSFSLKLDPAKP